MKKLLLPAVTLFLSAQSFAGPGPMSAMNNYKPTNHTKAELNRYWSEMNTNVKGKDCYKRAHIWSYEMKQYHNVDSTKVFMHYTDKFNREIDSMGGDFSWFERRVLNRGGMRNNKGWDYHVAPAIRVNGKAVVMDPRLFKTPLSTYDWVEGLAARGERILKTRQLKMIKELDEHRAKIRNTSSERRIKKYSKKINTIKEKLQRLGLNENPHQVIDIKCKKVTHMEEVDMNQETEWCMYSEASMYYWNPVDLRMLNYGTYTKYDYRRPVTDASVQTEENYASGALTEKKVFTEKSLEWSRGEFKREEE